MTLSSDHREALRKHLDVLDRSIGELSKVRYDLANALLEAESTERDSTPQREAVTS